MYQGLGEFALQASCGGFDSHCVHESRLLIEENILWISQLLIN